MNTNTYRNQFINFKYLYSSELSLFGNDVNQSTEVGILYGYLFKKGVIALSASGGVSAFFYHEKADFSNNYQKKDYKVASIPLEVKFMVVPLRFISLGASYIATLNTIKGYNGF